MQLNQNSFRTRTRMVAIMLLLVLPLVFLSACGAKLGKQITKVNYYPKCYEPVATLRKNASELTKNVAAGAALGAIGGAIIGYQATGDAKGAVIGAVAGAVVGGGLSYLITSEVQAKSTAERFQAYNETINAEIAKVDLGVQGARMALQCYTNEYKALNASYQKGTVNKEEMLARLKEINDGATETQTILVNYKDIADKNVQQFEEIVKVERQRTQDKPTANQMRQLNSTRTKVVKAQKDVDIQIANATQLTGDIGKQINLLGSTAGLWTIQTADSTTAYSPACSVN